MAKAKTNVLKFRTLPEAGALQLPGYDEPFTDEVVIEDPDPELVRLVSHAHAAGAVVVEEGLDLSDVQTQEDAEAAYAEAQGEWVEPEQNEDGTTTPGYWTGAWQQGNVLQHRLQAAQNRVEHAESAEDRDAAQEELDAVEDEIRAMLGRG